VCLLSVSLRPSSRLPVCLCSDLVVRITQLNKWGLESAPRVFLLGGLTHPMSFLTALLQHAARKNSQSFENLTWEFAVYAMAEQTINAQPKEGAYIRGLWLEGARWDVDLGTLAEPNPMELYCPMPIVQFRPVEKDKKKNAKGVYRCPLYNYPTRGGQGGGPSSLLLDVDLKTGPRGDWQFWAKRGTALLLTRDDV
jgi:dynein heavy chain, axonemal